MMSYTLLSGETIDLKEELAPGERKFIRTLKRLEKDDVGYFELCRVAIGPGSPALQGRNQVNRRILSSPLYQVARDIATRAGIAQGLILAPEYEQERAKAPQDFSMMSVVQAADLIGISRTAVYKAIERGTLKAHKIGNVTVVERLSAIEYRGRLESRGVKTRGRTSRDAASGNGQGVASDQPAAVAAKSE